MCATEKYNVNVTHCTLQKLIIAWITHQENWQVYVPSWGYGEGMTVLMINKIKYWFVTSRWEFGFLGQPFQVWKITQNSAGKNICATFLI